MIGNCPGVDAVARALVVAKAWNSDEPRGLCSASCQQTKPVPTGRFCAPHWEPTFRPSESVRFFCGARILACRVAIRGDIEFLRGARSQRAASRLFSTPGAGSTTNDQTNPISPNPFGINAIQWSRHGKTNEQQTSPRICLWHAGSMRELFLPRIRGESSGEAGPTSACSFPSSESHDRRGHRRSRNVLHRRGRLQSHFPADGRGRPD